MKVSIFTELDVVVSPPTIVDVSSVLRRIESGANGTKELVEGIRNATSKSEKGELKKKLPAIVFTGEMTTGVKKTARKGYKYISYRDDACLTTHSGLAVIDIDHVGVNADNFKMILSLCEYVYAYFVSPSGDGIKCLFRIPKDIENHRNHYRAIIDFLYDRGIEVDSTGINEARLCFMSYDPFIYINEEAEVFTDMKKEEVREVVEGVTGNGLTDYDKLIAPCKMIDSAIEGEKHPTLVKASYLVGGYIGAGYIDEDEGREALRRRIKARSPSDIQKAYSTIDDGIEAGKKQPIAKIKEIEDEFEEHLNENDFFHESRGYSFLVDNKEVDEKMFNYMKDGALKGRTLGIEELDRHFRLKENNFSVFMGHDNVGKSWLVWWIAVVAAMKYDWKWIIYSPENDASRVKMIMIQYVLGGRARGEGDNKTMMAKKFIEDHFVFIRKDKPFMMGDILHFSKILCSNDPTIKGLLVDPYNSLEIDLKVNSHEYHQKVAGHIRVFAERFCTVYLTAHSNTDARRAGKTDDKGFSPRPYKTAIEGGGKWANRCDDFYVIHRHLQHPTESGVTEFYTDKVKDTETGNLPTRGDEVVKLRLDLKKRWDFFDENDQSPLTEVRKKFFREGEQSRMDIPDLPMETGSPEDAF